jgi:phosphopantothenoylcysteine decarboxylase/phosphopantothenate--cysteine ligase
VVPATANILAKMRMGLADDLISSALLAVPADTPVVVAPAMNVNMWQNPATQDNVHVLEDRGYEFVFPVEGRLACDYVGEGKLATIGKIADTVLDALEDEVSVEDRTLAGLTVLVTAGPTHEAIDPVRYIANASSGKMGFALAEEAARMGARVTLVAGPVSLETPAGVDRIDVVSAQDMYEATTEAFRDVDIAICAAAVADYTPKAASDHKLKKATEHLDAIELVETKDILKTLCETKGEGGRTRIVCGFAAETNDLIEHAQDKLKRKNCDLIIANDVSRSDSTFGSDTNHVTLVTPAGPIELPTLPKGEVASRILAFLAGMAQAAGQMRS